MREMGLLGPGAVELVLAGKAYNKAMRAHKLTLQALWRLLVSKASFHLCRGGRGRGLSWLSFNDGC